MFSFSVEQVRLCLDPGCHSKNTVGFSPTHDGTLLGWSRFYLRCVQNKKKKQLYLILKGDLCIHVLDDKHLLEPLAHSWLWLEMVDRLQVWILPQKIGTRLSHAGMPWVSELRTTSSASCRRRPSLLQASDVRWQVPRYCLRYSLERWMSFCRCCGTTRWPSRTTSRCPGRWSRWLSPGIFPCTAGSSSMSSSRWLLLIISSCKLSKLIGMFLGTRTAWSRWCCSCHLCHLDSPPRPLWYDKSSSPPSS